MRRDAGFCGQPQAEADWEQAEHTGLLGWVVSKPSRRERPPNHLPIPNPTPKIRTARASKILGVSFIGTIDAICRLLILVSD